MNSIKIELKEINQVGLYIMEKLQALDVHPSYPLSRVIDYAKGQEAVWALVEEDYIDTEYLDLLSTHYYRYLDPPPNTTYRIHFLKKKIDPSNPLSFQQLDSEDYLGYCSVRRPTLIGKEMRLLGQVSRTLLKPPQKKRCIPCHAEFAACLLGKRFSFQSTPFIQQDLSVGTCAQASIWTALRYLSAKWGRDKVRISEITKAANVQRQIGPIFPATGLYDDQMLKAFATFGYSPLYEQAIQSDHALFEHTLYKCVESGLPVILNYDKDGAQHAICIVGHCFDSNPDTSFKLPVEKKIKKQSGAPATPADPAVKNEIYTPLNFFSEFVCHDDAEGPYQTIKIRDLLAANKIESMIVPFPGDVNYFGRDLEFYCVKWLIDIAGLHPEDQKKLLLRCFMMPSNDFKAAIMDPSHEMGEDAKRFYLNSSMPKFIWVAEISTIDDFSTDKSQIRIKGEFIFDTITNPAFSRIKFLSVHIYGLLLVNSGGQVPEKIVLHTDTPAYRCLTRQYSDLP
jgi:hypothetical protein